MSTIKYLAGNASFSAATAAQGIVHISGQVPELEYTTIEDQTKNVLSKIELILQQMNASKSTLLSATLYLKDLADFPVVNQRWNEWLGDLPRPARATIKAELVNPDWKVEISAVALQE